VAADDTLSAIAAKVGVPVADLISANHLGPDGSIMVGQKLVVPGAKSAARAPAAGPATTAPKPAPAAGGSTVVAAGDTVSEIAARAGVSVVDLIAANHLSPDGLIAVGQKLVVPSGGTAATGQTTNSARPATMTVAAGDSLSGIAARVGVSVQALVDLNHLKSADDIQAGQTLKVPAP